REAEQRSDESDGAERSRKYDAWMEDLVADPGESSEKEQRDDVRIDQRIEQTREEARMHLVDLGAGEVQHETLRGRLVAVERLQKRRQRRRNPVDHVHLQRLLRR